MAAAGQMAEEDVPSYIPKNVITRSLGPHENVNIDLEGPFDAAAGDVFLLCSDGLSGQIHDAEIGAILHCLSPQDAVQTLVDLANLRGGPDNISIVVARVDRRHGVVQEARPPRSRLRRWSAEPVRSARTCCCRWPAWPRLLALTFCLVNEWWIAAAVAGVAVAHVVGNHLQQAQRASGGGDPVSLGGPYGNGPYRDTVGRTE